MLTAQQQAAVDADAHAIEIRAGAGCGKTHTLVHRVAALAPDWQTQRRIQVVTFTREATATLQRRLGLLLGRDHAVRVTSFHQWAARALPQHERRFLDVNEGRKLVTRALRRRPHVGQALGDEAVNKVQGLISFAKNRELDIAAAAEHFPDMLAWSGELDLIAQEVANRQGDQLDFDDVLLRFRDKLRDDAAFRFTVRRELDHLLVDEYQDINPAQDDIVRLVAARDGPVRVTIVGDPRQAIYAFRGGAPRYQEAFLSHYGRDGRLLHLTTNFRSGRPLIAAANLLAPDHKPLRPARGAKRAQAPHLRPTDNAEAEATAILDHLDRLHAQGTDPTEIVVLARARRLADAYGEEAHARAADLRWAHKNGETLSAALDEVARGLRTDDSRRGISPALARLKDRRTARLIRRAAQAWQWPVRPTAKHLAGIDWHALDHHHPATTIHAAKGLEWDHVILLGAREGGLPSPQAMFAPERTRDELLAEESRLLYVAATRARRSLLVTWPENKRGTARSRLLDAWVEGDEGGGAPDRPARRPATATTAQPRPARAVGAAAASPRAGVEA